MPELPEVETIARTLRGELGAPPLLGRQISSVHVLWAREVAHPEPDVFTQRAAGSTVTGIRRHGKYLLIELQAATPMVMAIHLKMSGRLDMVSAREAFTPHARVVWSLDDGSALRFEDARKFGRVWLLDRPSALLAPLGPDALTVEAEVFVQRLRSRRTRLKTLLLDQTFIAGVGNIYADEAAHRAGIHPCRKTASLTDSEVVRLHQAVQAVLCEGIAANGASFDWVYPGGHYQENFWVYGRAGQPCRKCGAPIMRTVLAQRSTYYCPTCQPLDR
ncbi:MAG: DNA-formamidopyrimidine glycosylase [Anaerolineae bacterium]|nr:DNA-formamidopyrimidine glycosylase [Thermoflexales bacterium]MDW8396521.1 DNA-formamidopyrimidine glycosylase [Anaerolineae bacterium]